MIFKVRKHHSQQHLRNLVRYLLSRKGKSNERVLRHESLNALPMLPGESPLNYAKQWSAALWNFTTQERCGKPPPEDYFVHSVMSFFPGNAEHAADQLTAEQAIALAKEAMAEVAPGERQVLYVVHGDKAHLHVHIAFSVVERGGRIWNPHHDFRLWESAAARLEVKYGLYQVTVGRPGGEPVLKKSPTSNELNMAIRTGKPSDRMLLQELVSAALAGKPSFPTFWNRLLDAGVTPIPSIATTGRVSGISFQYEQGLPMKGSDLGKGFSWPALAKQLNFAASQHLHLVKPFALKREPVGGELQVGSGVEILPITAPAIGQPVLARFIAKPVDDQCTDWVWRNKPKRIAFVERPKVYLACSGHPLVHEAIAERAKQRGVKTMAVMGSEEFRKRMWFELSLREIAVTGYQPTEQEKQGLKWWIHEQTKAGGAGCSADVGKPDGDAVVGIGNQAGQNATGQGGDQRGVGGSDVSSAPGYDDTGSGKPSAAERHALSGEQGSERAAPGNGGASRLVAEPERGAQQPSSCKRLNPSNQPVVQLRRVERMERASALRLGIHSLKQHRAWHDTMSLLFTLDRQFRRWSITYGKPNSPALGRISNKDKLQDAWSQLLVLNSIGCNIELNLNGLQSWLNLVNPTQADLLWLAEQGMAPVVRFCRGELSEAYVHVSFGCERSAVMQRLVDQVAMQVSAEVYAHVGGISFPVAGFDNWNEQGEIQQVKSISFDDGQEGLQLSKFFWEISEELSREVKPMTWSSEEELLVSGSELLECGVKIEPEQFVEVRARDNQPHPG